MNKDKTSLIDRPLELFDYINTQMKPKEKEKKQYGEVFTPVNLVNSVLDKLPSEIWTNPNLKWFDPACGIGNFIVIIYLRLFETLKQKIPDKKTRKKHILEKMLYMVDINKKNVNICKKIFDINNRYKLNIHVCNTLNHNIRKLFNVDNFDIIIGNPPYNASCDVACGQIIWDQFVYLGFDLLKQDGILSYITPGTWKRITDSKSKLYGLFDRMTKDNTMIYLEIHNADEGRKVFQAATNYDIYVILKRKNTDHTKTTILDETNKITKLDLTKYNWLPNFDFKLVFKLIADDDEDKCDVIYKRSYIPEKSYMNDKKTKKFKYPVVHSTPMDGPRILWSSRNDLGLYGIKKVIFGETGINNPIIDIRGEYAMSPGAIGIKIKSLEEGKKIADFLVSPIFSRILRACLWSSYRIEYKLIKAFKKNFYEIL